MLNYVKTIPYTINGKTYHLSNIILSVVLKRLNIDTTFLYRDEYIRQNETPEQISYRLYGDVRFWSIILLVNNIVNPYADLPLDNDLLYEYTKAKYQGNPNAIHWFYDERTNRICDDRSSLTWKAMYDKNETLPHYIIPVSHLDYEQKKNEEKMLISVINPKFIHTFEEILISTLNG